MKFNMKYRVKTFPACVHAYGSFSNIWSLIRLGDCLNIRNTSDYEEKYVGFNICIHLKMTLYSQSNPTRHLNSKQSSCSDIQVAFRSILCIFKTLCNTMQYFIRYNTIQYNAIQYNTIQYNIFLFRYRYLTSPHIPIFTPSGD